MKLKFVVEERTGNQIDRRREPKRKGRRGERSMMERERYAKNHKIWGPP